VTLDGTGLGTDGHIWGGEWLVGDYDGFRRAARLEYLPLPGGDAATRAPWRIAYSYVHTALGRVPGWALPPDVGDDEVSLLCQQIQRDLNCPRTSSMGRLFDAVSALLGICTWASYEAQAAIELEMAATGNSRVEGLRLSEGLVPGPYPFSIRAEGDVHVIALGQLFAALAGDVESGAAAGEIALRFHQTIARVAVAACERIAGDKDLRTVALSGGCFQNRLLLALTVPALRRAGFQVLLHRQVPCNDGGLSLGQAAIAHFQTQET
jgi:hydrogenase maturation protein HypF